MKRLLQILRVTMEVLLSNSKRKGKYWDIAEWKKLAFLFIIKNVITKINQGVYYVRKNFLYS